MIIVSGCPRSGTSLTMDIMREALGEDNIIGSKFPQEERFDLDKMEQGDEESNARFGARKYMMQKMMPDRGDDFKDMNPNGFWECRYSVQGIKYQYPIKGELEDILENGKDRVCKIVSQGLLASESRYIDKVVYLIRHPRNVAKSQERLKRGFDVEYGGEKHNIFEGLTIHTPEMYIEVTLQACRWFIENPDIPVIFVKFDDLQSNPNETIDKIAEFVGYGDFEASKKLVEPKLNRSKQEDIEHHLWEDAEYVYDQFLEGNYQEIINEFANNQFREFNRLRTRWRCTRINMPVNCMDCNKCKSNPTIVENYKLRAKSMGIDYLNEPCLYDCGFNVDSYPEDQLTVEESIANNTWDVDNTAERQMIEYYRNNPECCDEDEDSPIQTLG